MDRDAVRRYVARLDAERARPLAEQLEDEVGDYRGMTMEQRGEVLAGLCRSGWSIMMSRPDVDRMVAWEDPRSPDFDSVWRRLMERRRGR